MTDFTRTITSRRNGASPVEIKLDCEIGDDVQINIHPAECCWPNLTIFISPRAARELAHALLSAVDVTENADV